MHGRRPSEPIVPKRNLLADQTMLLLLALWIARRALRHRNGASVAIILPHSSHTQCRWAAIVIGVLPVCGGGSDLFARESESGEDELATLPAPAAQLAELEPPGGDSVVIPHLREGTRIGETVGRVVMMGRRWAFVRASQQNPPEPDIALRPRRLPAIDGKPRPKRLGLASGPRLTRLTAIPIELQTGRENATEIPTRHMLITENLMLQRIVEAIRADGSDNVWSVTGEVTEFFNENRLIIHTAKRAGSR